MAKALYNPASAKSILKHGEALLGHSLKELHDDAVIFNGKGGLGTSVEFFHYGYEPNSDAEPDFAEAGMELKCTGFNLPMPSNRHLYHSLTLLFAVLLFPLLGVLLLSTCLSNKFHNLGKSILGSLAYGTENILEVIQSRIRKLRLQVHHVYGVLRQVVLKVFAGRSLFNLPHAIFVIKQKLSLTDTRIVDVARMLETAMLRIVVPPMCGNNASANTHPAFIFNVRMGNQKFAEFKRCNPIHRGDF